MSEAIVGIVGGMGPESTIDLMKKIFDATPAAREQDHIHLIADSNPKIPDRAWSIVGGGESPVPVLCDSVRRLTAAGADLIVIACNTAHVYYDEMQAATTVPILHMIELCVRHAAEQCPGGSTVGLLATTGTVKAGLYGRALRAKGLSAIMPDSAGQDELMDAIFGERGIKLGYLQENRPRVAALGRELMDRGAAAVIAGCTEIGLVLADCDFPAVDPLRLLADEVVRRVKGDAASKE